MTKQKKSTNIVVAGYIICGPLGGLVWHHLQYVLGLHRMGYNVLFVEDSQDYPACYQPATFALSTDPSYGIRFITAIFARHSMQGRWAYFDSHTNSWLGRSKQEVEDFVAGADVYINLSGVDPLRPHFQNIPLRVLVDTDPAFTQIRHLTEEGAMGLAQRHNRFFTFGENFGKPGCGIPDDGLPWLPTRQPVVLDAWPTETLVNGGARWTTVMQWDSYKAREFGGRRYGMKSSSFDPFLQLPQKVDMPLELALGSATAPREKLAASGWHVSDPLPVSQTPQTYQSYIAQSKGEWSVAKQGYVASNSGWFSERSCSYLASAKPVVVQDTGFSSLLPTGRGLLSFSTVEEAAEALCRAGTDYRFHCRNARELAVSFFDAKAVLSSLLERL